MLFIYLFIKVIYLRFSGSSPPWKSLVATTNLGITFRNVFGKAFRSLTVRVSISFHIYLQRLGTALQNFAGVFPSLIRSHLAKKKLKKTDEKRTKQFSPKISMNSSRAAHHNRTIWFVQYGCMGKTPVLSSPQTCKLTAIILTPYILAVLRHHTGIRVHGLQIVHFGYNNVQISWKVDIFSTID